MCVTNKLEGSIVTLVLIRNTMLRLTHATDSGMIVKWLDNIKVPEKRFMTSVRKIQSCYEPSTDVIDFAKSHMSFALKCPTLTDLTISISARELTDKPQKAHSESGTFREQLARLRQSPREEPKALT